MPFRKCEKTCLVSWSERESIFLKLRKHLPWRSLPCWLWPLLEPPLCRPRCRHTEAAARRAHHSACAHRAPRSDSSEVDGERRYTATRAHSQRANVQTTTPAAGASGGWGQRRAHFLSDSHGREEIRAEQRPGAETRSRGAGEQGSGARMERSAEGDSEVEVRVHGGGRS